ncbi:putative endonuclease [Leeuwenhoekiella aestuarii]|uniref:GIY-YIG nuclease family protein n=1 Tax=Leeuwenhoekiella aestuarii TaxID=2249426 RepID=UPI000FFEE7CC|nr:GIY-YIG nuclease family protein [Leeuwenhoekiella aestuarii]RXG12950.1 putative endonuclease [Leeuwenhoekiella aestuarii]
MEELFYTYILTNRNHTVLYIGVTSDLRKRLKQHTQKSNEGFTGKYNVEKLIYFESTPYVENAIKREKQLKKWNPAWKENLINEMNPDWKDLSWMVA